MGIEYLGVVLLVILVSMTLHEAMHGFVAYYLGDDTAKLRGRLTLNPLKHIDPILTIAMPLVLAIIGGPIFGGAKPVPFNPNRVRHEEFGVALVAVAGPLTNLMMAFVFYGLATVFFQNGSDGFIFESLRLAVMVNLGFFIFNMLPLPPLDGSRVLYAFSPDGIRRGMEAIERFGIIPIFILIMVASPFISSLMIAGMEAILAVFSGIFGV